MTADPMMPDPVSGSALLQDEVLTRGVLLRRLVAWVFDLVLIGLLLCVAWWVLLGFGLMTLGLGLPLLALLPLVPFCYHLLFLAGPLAATPGQALMGLVVLRNDDFARPMPLQAVVSTLCFYLTIALGVIWLAVAALTVRRRTLHDMLAGLVVVRRRALTPPGPAWNMVGGFPHA